MDNVISRGILMGNHPPRGMYYTVNIAYFESNPIFSKAPPENLVSDPYATFPTALEASTDVADTLIREKFKGAIKHELEPDEADGFHLIIVDQAGQPIAKIGVDINDNRDKTLQ